MKRTLAILGLAALALGCSDGRRYDQAIGVLIDVSGTYADEKARTVDVIKREILPNLVPGDTLLIVRIDSESYDKDNVEALLTLDRRPSHANAQKLAVARRLEAFAAEGDGTGSEHTDIPGAIMLASEYLNEVEAGSRVMLVFSDMQEDLPDGARRKLGQTELQGTHVAAINACQTEDRFSPESVWYREGEIHNPDPRLGALHPVMAVLASESHLDAAEFWLNFPGALAPFLFLAFTAFARSLLPRGWAWITPPMASEP